MDRSCIRQSGRYYRVYVRKLAALRDAAAAAPPQPSHSENRTRHVPLPANAEASPSRRDPKIDAPVPAHDSLVGEDGHSPGLDSARVALFWRSEVSRAEGLANAADRHLRFTRQMCAEALARCLAAPPAKGSRFKRVRVISPDKGKERAQPDEEAPSRDKGKGPAEPMDEDKSAAEDKRAEREDEDDDTWFGFDDTWVGFGEPAGHSS